MAIRQFGAEGLGEYSDYDSKIIGDLNKLQPGHKFKISGTVILSDLTKSAWWFGGYGHLEDVRVIDGNIDDIRAQSVLIIDPAEERCKNLKRQIKAKGSERTKLQELGEGGFPENFFVRLGNGELVPLVYQNPHEWAIWLGRIGLVAIAAAGITQVVHSLSQSSLENSQSGISGNLVRDGNGHILPTPDWYSILATPAIIPTPNYESFNYESGTRGYLIQTSKPLTFDSAVVQSYDPQKRSLRLEVNNALVDKPLTSFLKAEDWTPTNLTNFPRESVLYKTAGETSSAIDFINSLYRSNGINDVAIPYITPDDFIIKLDGPHTFVTDTQHITIYPLIFMDTLWGSGGYPLSTKDGVMFFDNNRQSDAHRWKEIQMLTHERIHSGQKYFDYAEEYYDQNTTLTEALEDYTNYVSYIAVEKVFPEASDVTKGKWSTAKAWGNKIVSDLNTAKLNGMRTLLYYGSRGDMAGLQKVYESKYGAGSFAKLRDKVSGK